MSPCLELVGVSKTYSVGGEPLNALEPVSFSISQGEFVSLIGPSGCGKTTVLNLIAGLEEPSSGSILIDGRPARGPGRDRGMVFQNYSLYPWLTVEQNIRFPLRLGVNTRRSQEELWRDLAYAEHLLEIMGLTKFARAYPRELSGGMQQRVAIARALLNRPRVLLMDEPFGALDAQTREEMQELMLLLSRLERSTILFVTHDIEEALYLSDRLLIFSTHPGQIIREAVGPLERERGLDIKMTPVFLSMKRELTRLLRSTAKPTFDRDLLRRTIGNKSSIR